MYLNGYKIKDINNNKKIMKTFLCIFDPSYVENNTLFSMTIAGVNSWIFQQCLITNCPGNCMTLCQRDVKINDLDYGQPKPDLTRRKFCSVDIKISGDGK